jgi:hypothetical protein
MTYDKSFSVSAVSSPVDFDADSDWIGGTNCELPLLFSCIIIKKGVESESHLRRTPGGIDTPHMLAGAFFLCPGKLIEGRYCGPRLNP